MPYSTWPVAGSLSDQETVASVWVTLATVMALMTGPAALAVGAAVGTGVATGVGAGVAVVVGVGTGVGVGVLPESVVNVRSDETDTLPEASRDVAR